MSFCKYSSSLIESNSIPLEMSFINDYLPRANGDCIKVYLFGLLKCQNSGATDNTIENFENVLGLSRQDIIDSFLYWQDQNLVQFLDVDPMEVKYLPVKDSSKFLKIVEPKKYQAFTKEVQNIISGRQILNNEYNRYIDFIENYKFQPCDFNMIVKYCVDKKGNDVNCNYILTVAKVWAEEGIKTAEKIEEKIESLTLITSDVNKVAKALKFNGNLSIEHQTMYQKWTKAFGFNLNTILDLAKKVSSQTKKFGFEGLDKLLLKYYELKLMSFGEIQQYEANKADLIKFAKEINKALGLFYESVENEVETYINPWINKGFSVQALLQIANFCFKSTIRTLEGMDQTVQKFYKLGLVSVSSIDNHLSEIIAIDKKIKVCLQKLNIDRRVNNFDRSFYRTWTYTYKFGEDIIAYALELSTNKANGMQYANALLRDWYDKGLKNLEEIKSNSKNNVAFQPVSFERKSFATRSYSEEELNALFDNLDEINL